MLSYELIYDDPTKISVFVVVYSQFRRIIPIDYEFQCKHNLNQLLGSIISFGLKITSSNFVEVVKIKLKFHMEKRKKSAAPQIIRGDKISEHSKLHMILKVESKKVGENVV